jgi:hypothetical protein
MRVCTQGLLRDPLTRLALVDQVVQRVLSEQGFSLSEEEVLRHYVWKGECDGREEEHEAREKRS